MAAKLDAARREEILYELVNRCVVGADGRTESVTDVAGALRISRNSAHLLLREARLQGIVRTTVLLRRPAGDTLTDRVREYLADFGVRRVLVLSTLADDRLSHSVEYHRSVQRALGALAAEFLARDGALEPNDHVCVTGGSALMSFAEHFIPPVSNLFFRPLASLARWRPLSHTDASAVLQYLYTRSLADSTTRKQHIQVFCPETPSPFTPGNSTRRTPELDAVFGPRSPQPKAVIAVAGRRRYFPSKSKLGPHAKTSPFVRIIAETGHYISAREKLTAEAIFSSLADRVYRAANAGLFAEGIVGSFGLHALSRDGKAKASVLSGASCNVALETLRRWQAGGSTNLLICGGSRFLHVFEAALRSQCFNSCVIDTALAVQLLDRDQRPELYRHIPRLGAPVEIESDDPTIAYEATT